MNKKTFADYLLNFNKPKISKEDEIRQFRRTICFPIINRGKPWYDTLTSEQYQEVITWYQKWLDAPVTKVIPKMPEWLKKEVR